MDIITEWVYWYPPSNIEPNMIIGINTDTLGMVYVNVAIGLLGTNSNFVFGSFSENQISMTPEAYVAWYNSNRSAFQSSKGAPSFLFMYNTLTSPINGYSSWSDYNKAYLSAENYYWKKRSALNLNDYQNIAGTPPSDNGNLYALIKSVATPQQTVLVSQTGVTTAPPTSDTVSAAQQAQEAAAMNSQVAQSITIPISTINQSTPAGQAAAALNKAISNTPFQLDFELIIAAIGIVGAAIIVYSLKK